MGDHAPEAKDEASSAGNMPAARKAPADAGGAAARKPAQHARDTSAPRKAAAHAGGAAATKTAQQAGDTSAARLTAAHAGDAAAMGIAAHAGNAAARRTVAYRYEGSVHHAADTVASSGPGQRGLDGHAKKRGSKCLVAEEGKGVKKSRSSCAQASRAEGSIEEKKPRRLIDRYDMTVANKNAMAAVGGKIPDFVRIAAEKEAIEASAPRMKAIARMMNQMAGGVVPGPVPSGVPVPDPVQRRPQLQPRTDPEPQPHPKPDHDTEPQLEQRALRQPDLSCPRCHTSMGTEALRHLCRCVDCSRTTDPCPYCCLAALPKVDCARGMCPSCGKRAGKEALDHICLCDTCRDCPLCNLANLPRPLPHRDGTCPCCCEKAGKPSNHLCLCYKCKLVPGSACPYCVLSDTPSALHPFDCIRRLAYWMK